MPSPKDKQKSVESRRMPHIEITRLGQQGDGMAIIDSKPVSFPLTMPGDIISATIEYQSKNKYSISNLQLEKSASLRKKPPCPHHASLEATGCGGCSLQFLDTQTTYHDWKSDLPRHCLSKAGVSLDGIEFRPMIQANLKTRRRAVFSAFHTGTSISLGFYEQGSNRVVEWQECMVITPELAAIKETLPEILPLIMQPQNKVRIHCTALEQQSDIVFIANNRLDESNINAIQQWAQSNGHTRVSWQTSDKAATPHILYEDKPVIKSCYSYSVPLPSGSFLQPSKEGEQALIDAVLYYLSDITNINRAMDLFCGLGTFTLPLYRRYLPLKSLQAFDINGGAIKNLHHLAQKENLAGLDVQPRDLFTHPVTASELKRMDVVVIDPPRIGAKAQCEQLAQSRAPHIVMVSCNPLTMARDAKILCDGGYTLSSVTPVDQFLWSSHLETVSYFTRT